VSVLKQHDIMLPDDVLLQFINKEEIEAYRKNPSAVISITINGQKPKA
jgi:hypothetical protein